MSKDRVVVVPARQRAVLVSEQLLAHFQDWTPVGGPLVAGLAAGKQIEARAVSAEDGLTVEIETRYVYD